MPDQDDELTRAKDAIPKDAIWLTDAYELVVDLVSEHPERLPRFDEDWCEALRKSRQLEQTVGHDSDTFDKDLEEEWHCRKEANLFLRLEIEEKRITTCTRDPQTGDVLQLPSDGWVSDAWDGYIPPGIWSDYIVPGDYEAPGPNGTFIHGALRPVFFIRSEFEAWLKETFGSEVSLNPKEGTRVRDAVKEAVRAIWGSPPAGVAATRKQERINSWLAENGRLGASLQTIRRALSEMRRERT